MSMPDLFISRRAAVFISRRALPLPAVLPADVVARRRVGERALGQAVVIFGFTRAELLGPRGPAPLSRARQWVMAELRAAGWSLPRIGRFLGRDHTTVLHGLRCEAARRAEGAE